MLYSNEYQISILWDELWWWVESKLLLLRERQFSKISNIKNKNSQNIHYGKPLLSSPTLTSLIIQVRNHVNFAKNEQQICVSPLRGCYWSARKKYHQDFWSGHWPKWNLFCYCTWLWDQILFWSYTTDINNSSFGLFEQDFTHVPPKNFF